MSGNKRYYWLKLNENFFDREEIKVIENMKNGKDYIIFYLKLLLKSIKTEGELRFRDVIPYTPEMLAAITNTDIDTVRVAIDLFTKLDLMEIWDDGTLFMSETQNMIGSETGWAKQKRIQRQKNKELLERKDNVQQIEDNVQNVSTECPTDIEIDIDKELEKEIEEEEEEKKESSAASALYDKDFKLIIKKYNENIRPITPVEAERLEKWMDDMDADVIVSAIEEAVLYNKRSLKYIEGILRGWNGNSIRTKADLDAYMRDRADKKNKTENRKHQGLNKQTDFNKFEHHEYSEDELESLFVDIGAG